MINEAVILLGGMGTRLLPYTKTISKEMLPIYDVPNIFLLVKEAYLSGIKKIIFVTTEHNKYLIQNFFSEDKYLNDFLKDKPDKKILLKEIDEIINNIKFVYINQKEKGSYGALYSAKDYIENDNFIVMYGDDLIDSDIPLSKCLINEFKKTNAMQVAIKKVPFDELPNTGIVKLDNNNYLLDLVTKKEKHNNALLHGRMLLNKKIFEIKDNLPIHENDEYYLPYALLNFKDVKAYLYQGEYFNIGNKIGFIKASIHYALKDQKIKNELLKYINEIKEK